MSLSVSASQTNGMAAPEPSFAKQPNIVGKGQNKVENVAKSQFVQAEKVSKSVHIQSKRLPSISKTHDPQAFFSMFKGYNHSMFQPEHIEHLHHLMEKNVLGGYVHFADLIGLDCLETIEQARLFFSPEAYQNNEQVWINIYMQWVFGSLRTHLNNEDIRSVTEYTFQVFVLGRSLLDILTVFTKAFFEDLEREYAKKLSATHSKAICEKLKVESVKIPLIKARWQKNMDLITAIMSSSDRGLLFFRTSLQHFNQGQLKLAGSVDEGKQSLSHMQKLCVLFKRGLILGNLKPENIKFFQDVIEALGNVITAGGKGLKQACDKLQQELKDKEVFLEYGGQVMTSRALAIGEHIATLDQPSLLKQAHKDYELQIYQLLLNYYSELMIHKIAAQLDVMMLPAVCQNHVPRIAWINRAFTAIKTILEKDIPIALMKAAVDVHTDEAMWKKNLSKLRLEYSLKIFGYHQLLNYLEQSRYEYGYLRLFYDKGVSCFAVELEKMVAESIDSFEKALEGFAPAVECLVEETDWLSKLLFLEHDLNVLIGKQEPKDDEEILAPYLSVLDRVYYRAAEKRAAELYQQQIQAQADQELQELIAQIEQIDITIGQVQSKLLPQQSLHELSVQRPKPAKVLPPRASPPCEKETTSVKRASSTGKFTEDEAKAFKSWKNATWEMVEKTLRKIGLEFLRQRGSHRQYGIKDDKSVRTTIAVHAGATVHPSILNKIVHQVGVVKP